MRAGPGRALSLGAAALLCTMLTVAVACKSDTKTKGAGTPARPDPAVLLEQSAARMEQVKSFHFVLEHEKGASPIVLGLLMNRAEGDVLRPDRLRADVDASFSGVKLKLQLVSIGDTAKITNPFNPAQWQDLPTGTKINDVFDPAAGTTAALRSVKNPQITGEEQIGGVKVWKVEGDVDAAAVSALVTIAESGYTARGTAWIGQQSHEVYRIRLDGALGSQDTPGVIRRLELSRYDENIAITPPPTS